MRVLLIAYCLLHSICHRCTDIKVFSLCYFCSFCHIVDPIAVSLRVLGYFSDLRFYSYNITVMYKRNVLVLNWSFFSNYVDDVSKVLIFSDLCNAIYTFNFSPRCF